MGLSVLVPPDATMLTVTARWGDYKAMAKDGALTSKWRRTERAGSVTVQIVKERAQPAAAAIPESGGLQTVSSIRRVRGLEDMPGLPAGTRAASVFLVNRREALEGLDDLKDERSVFQASLTVESDRPLVARPNPRGHEHHDADERIADLQYRDALEFAVGHRTSVHGVMTGRECRAAQTTWMPQCEVERVEPAELKNVELGMEALAAAPDAATLRASLSSLVAEYGKWINEQAAAAPKEKHRAEVAADLLDAARRAAKRINDGLSLLDDPLVLEAFRLANRAMALAARQRRSQETGKPPASLDPPAWRPLQLAFVLMNLRSFVSPTHPDRELVDLLFFPTCCGQTE